MNRKRLIELIASIFVAVIFLSSYISFANINGSGSKSTTTTAPLLGTYAFGFYSAKITNYTGALGISMSCSNKTVENESYSGVGNILSRLEQNNSIAGFYPTGNGYTVQNNSIGILALYKLINSSMNGTANSCLRFSSAFTAHLPPIINFTINQQQYSLPIPLNFSVYQVTVPLPTPKNNTIRLKVAALVSSNGTIYSINVTRAG